MRKWVGIRLHRVWHRGLGFPCSCACATLIMIAGAVSGAATQRSSQPSSPPIPQIDTTFIDSSGSVHITRIIPVPTTISWQAQHLLARPAGSAGNKPRNLAEQRAAVGAAQARAGKRFRTLYPIQGIRDQMIAGIPVKIIEPIRTPRLKRERVLMYLHGGGFELNSGVMTSSIPIAYFTQTKVVVVLYRLAPEHPFPAALEDAIAVYRELLKTHKPRNIGIYGTSAGATLTAEVAVKLHLMGLPLPGALGIFSGAGDFSQRGDSEAFFTVNGLHGVPDLNSANGGAIAYAGSTPRTDPVLSPLYADLRGLPPSLFISSTRDFLLSGTTILHRAFLRAGVDARLVVFEALPHTFWNDPALPESKEADQIIASFFDRELGRQHPSS